MGWKPDICLYHANCDDGFGAAWAIWQKWGDTIAYAPCSYGDPLLSAADMNVLMVDFSYKRNELTKLAFDAKSVVVLDHHKTAQEELEFFTIPGMTRFTVDDVPFKNHRKITALFDMERSGARLAWEFAHPSDAVEHPRFQEMPLMLRLIEDRDLWRFRYPETRPFSAALRTYPQDFETWETISHSVPQLVEEGVTILRAHDANIKKFTEQTYFATIGGYYVPVVNVPYHYASDTAHHLLGQFEGAAFAACWFRRADGKVQFSLRSEDARADVSEVAKKLGGGGHRNAAGFTLAAIDTVI